ncbi:MAG: Lacal_2735 family protein [Bacteroidia bacterium]
MFKIFKRKSVLESLERQHAKLLREAFNLSKINRTAADQKYMEADALMGRMQNLQD